MNRAFAILAFLTLAGFATGDEGPARFPVNDAVLARALRTDHYGVYLIDKKVGFGSVSLARVQEGDTAVYRASLDLVLKITSAEVKSEVHIQQQQDFDSTPPYALRGGRATESNGKTTKRIALVRTAQGFQATLLAGGEKSIQKVPGIDFSLVDLLTPTVWLQRGPRPEAKLTTRSFDFESLRTDREIRKLLATRTTTAAGVKVTYHEVEVNSVKDKIVSFERYDGAGERILSMKIAGQFELRLESEKESKNIEYSADLFVLGTVKIDKPLGDPANVARLDIEVEGEGSSIIKDGPRQEVTAVGPTKLLCKTGKGRGKEVPAADGDVQDNLAESIAYPINHPKVQALAKEAVGDAKAPREKVARLVGFVSTYITPSYTAQPLSLLDLLKGRKGDCTEYALLFTTLARAAGIPAREVSGLLYIGDEARAFGPHAWNEVVLDGTWVPVDASCDETEINATHIRFGPASGEGIAGFLTSLGKLSFKLVGVERGGQKPRK